MAEDFFISPRVRTKKYAGRVAPSIQGAQPSATLRTRPNACREKNQPGAAMVCVGLASGDQVNVSSSLPKFFGFTPVPSLESRGAAAPNDLQVSEGSRREAGDRGLREGTDSRVARSLWTPFFSRNVGRFAELHCSASKASLVQVRAMSSRISCTRLLGARSAI
jgi:hypothetical protein